MAFIVTIFDTETTGLFSSALVDEKNKPELIEFMAVKMDLNTNTIIKEYEFLCKPQRKISAESEKITGINEETVKDAEPFAFYVADVRDALENTDAVIAHNLSYDKEMIDTEMARCGIKIKWPRMICTVEETICIRGHRLTLTDLHFELTGAKFEGAHRARHDVEALVKCVNILFERGYF